MYFWLRCENMLNGESGQCFGFADRVTDSLMSVCVNLYRHNVCVSEYVKVVCVFSPLCVCVCGQAGVELK